MKLISDVYLKRFPTVLEEYLFYVVGFSGKLLVRISGKIKILRLIRGKELIRMKEMRLMIE